MNTNSIKVTKCQKHFVVCRAEAELSISSRRQRPAQGQISLSKLQECWLLSSWWAWLHELWSGLMMFMNGCVISVTKFVNLRRVMLKTLSALTRDTKFKDQLGLHTCWLDAWHFHDSTRGLGYNTRIAYSVFSQSRVCVRASSDPGNVWQLVALH